MGLKDCQAEPVEAGFGAGLQHFWGVDFVS